jgi:hypothetical protein
MPVWPKAQISGFTLEAARISIRSRLSVSLNTTRTTRRSLLRHRQTWTILLMVAKTRIRLISFLSFPGLWARMSMVSVLPIISRSAYSLSRTLPIPSQYFINGYWPTHRYWGDPSLRLIGVDNDTTGDNFPPSFAPIFLDFDTGEWVYFLILGLYSQEDTPRTPINITHPIHLHGHDFVILAQGNTTFDPAVVKPNLNNPTRRDVAMLPAAGYLWIAFQVDNPGA